MKTNYITTIIILLFVTTGVAHAQDGPIRISGQIHIGMATPKTITIQNAIGNTWTTDVETETGIFLFERLPEGRYYFPMEHPAGGVIMRELYPGWYNIIHVPSEEDIVTHDEQVLGYSQHHNLYLPIIR